MLFLFVSTKNRASKPKGLNDDYVYAGEKSPAYPETQRRIWKEERCSK
jgi:hypothetical protein